MPSVYVEEGPAIVVVDKPRFADVILVSPINSLYKQQPGLISEYKENVKGDIKSFRDVDIETEHEITSQIEVRWRRLGGGNQMTAPNVCASETVMLYRNINTDEYVWDDLGREPGLRGKEDVIIGFSNVHAGSEKADVDTSMYIRYNTIDGYLEINAPANDGENAAYNIKLDSRNGFLTIADNQKNKLQLDSNKGKLTAEIEKEVEITTKKYILNADDIILNGKSLKSNISILTEFNTPLANFSKNVTVFATLLAGAIGSVKGKGGDGSVKADKIDVREANASVTNTVDLNATGKVTGKYPR